MPQTFTYPGKSQLRLVVFVAIWLLLLGTSILVHWVFLRLGEPPSKTWGVFLFGKAFGWVPLSIFAALFIGSVHRPSVMADEYGSCIPAGFFSFRRYRWSEIAYVQAVRASKRRRLSPYPPLRFWIWVSDRRRLPISFDEGIRDLPDLLACIDKKHVEYGFPLHYFANDSRNTRVPVPKPLPRGPVVDSLSSLMTEPPTEQRRAPGV